MRFINNLIGLLLLSLTSQSQQSQLKGVVQDASTHAPLAFVSIVIKNSDRGTVSDIDGNFLFNNPPGHAVLVVSYVGYETKEFTIENDARSIVILLSPGGNALADIEIKPGENPAWRIIRLVQANKKNNDPEMLPTFKYNAYTVAALGSGSQLWKMGEDSSSTSKKRAPTNTNQDTAKSALIRRIVQRFKDNYLMLTESYTERIFKYPGQSRETVIASKISGLKQAPVAFTTSNFQPFGFYKNSIEMLGKQYVNPLVNGSFSMYTFRLRETRVQGQDTTFVIAFEPKKNSRFDGLKGLLAINSRNYAIENLTATPAIEKGLIMRFKLQQKYELNNGYWFPAQLNSTILQIDNKTDSVMVYWDTRSYITNVTTNTTFTKADFSDLIVDYASGAGNRSEQEWASFRKDSLKSKEKNTYQTYQLLPAKTLDKLNRFNGLVEALALEAIPAGKIDIPFRHFISGINNYEKFRLGGGFQTNPRFNKHVSIGGFAGYGFGDKAFKYGGNLRWNLAERTVTTLSGAYSKDLAEPGNVAFFVRSSSVLSNQSLRNFVADRMDSVAQWRIDFSTKIRPWFTSSAWVLNEVRNPAAYNYSFKNGITNQSFSRFTNTEIGLGLRMTSGEHFTKIGRAKVLATPATTELLMQAAKGLPDLAGGELEYTRLAFQFTHRISMKKLGVTSFQINAGKIWGQVPYAYLFNTGASKSGKNNFLFIPNLFQTVGLYEFAADQSFSLFLQHSFGNLLLKPRNVHFRPELVLLHNFSIGSLRERAAHTGISFTAPDKGLLESGLMIKDIYRSDLQFAYFGFGGGVFYRYGNYSLPKASDNWAFKFVMSVSF